MIIFYHANKKSKKYLVIICSFRLFKNKVISFLKTGSKQFYKDFRHMQYF